MRTTRVKDIMTSHPTLINPNATLQEAAQKMQKVDCGALPVGTEDKLEGVITDRDIVVRAVSQGRDGSKEKVRDYMSRQVVACGENDSLEEVTDRMRRHQVSRLVVKDADGRVSGILSLGCILRRDTNAEELADLVKRAVAKKAA